RVGATRTVARSAAPRLDAGTCALPDLVTPCPSRPSFDGSARFHQEVGPAVLRPARLVLLRTDRLLCPEAHDRYALGRDATRDEVVAGRARPALAEGEVVLGGAALVAVPLDQHERL